MLVFTFGENLLGIYITDSTQAVEYGTIRLLYITLPYFLCGVLEVTTGALRGLGSSMAPMVISVMGICGIRLLWVYTVFQAPAMHNPHVLFASYPISWIVTFAVQLTAFLVLYKRLSITSLD